MFFILLLTYFSTPYNLYIASYQHHGYFEPVQFLSFYALPVCYPGNHVQYWPILQQHLGRYLLSFL